LELSESAKAAWSSGGRDSAQRPSRGSFGPATLVRDICLCRRVDGVDLWSLQTPWMSWYRTCPTMVTDGAAWVRNSRTSKPGTLEGTLPDGRRYGLAANGPGMPPPPPPPPHERLHLAFAFASASGGDYGMPEAYLHGEWDTPDLTQFCICFCVNQDWMQDDAHRPNP